MHTFYEEGNFSVHEQHVTLVLSSQFHQADEQPAEARLFTVRMEDTLMIASSTLNNF